MNQLSTYMLPIILTPLILFITSSLFYDQYQRGYLFTSRSSNETIFIDRALKRIATCNEQDHPRQKSLLYTFQAWTHLARSNHIRYWLGYKTLNGYLYHHDLSPYDHDIDILMMAQDTPQLIQLINTNYSSIYKLKVHPQWFITKVSNRSYFPSEGIDFKMQNARFINQKTNISINIWPVYDDYFDKNTLKLVHYLNFDSWILTPKDWTFPLEPCVISGIRVWCPAQAKKLTASIYGQTSTYLSCINGLWVNSKR